MSKDKVQRIDRNKLPWFYRLVLKVPGANFLENASSGVFWGVVVPLFLMLEFFLNMFLLLYFSFPINIILVGIFPIAILIIFIRISLERFINWWNLAYAESGFEWNIDKTLQEYLALIEKKEKEKE